MGYLWPPPWWRDTSLSPSADEEQTVQGAAELLFPPDAPVCMRCERLPFLGRRLNVGNNQMVCIDCFAFVTGIDDRDPIEAPTARSGDPRYVARSKREDTPPFELFPPAEDERPPLAPLPPGTPRWVRLLHWLVIRLVSER
jgi:hypothetical protein